MKIVEGNLRWFTTNLDHLRIPLNATERAERPGEIPYWGANGIVDRVDEALLNEPVVLIGEDGAPFFDRLKPVAFAVDEPIWPNNHIHILRVDPKRLDRDFLAHWLNSVDYARYINGSTRDKLTQRQLGGIRIRVPDLPTQKAIAAFLDRETARIDQLIEKKQRFLGLLQDKKTSWLSQLIGGHGVGGEDDWLAGCPLEWPRQRAKFVFRERDERSVDGAEDLLTASHLTGITRRSEKDVNMFLAETNVGYKSVFVGDFVINTMWAWMGAMGVSAVEGIISPSYGVYRPTTDHFEPRYFDLISRSKPFVAEATRRSKGIHSSRLRLYPDAFLDMRLPVPPRSAQRELLADYDRQLSHERNLSGLTEASIDRLKEYRSALITAAVTGQIDVETWSRRGKGDRRLDQIEEEMAG